jgi:hypothetical protein
MQACRKDRTRRIAKEAKAARWAAELARRAAKKAAEDAAILADPATQRKLSRLSKLRAEIVADVAATFFEDGKAAMRAVYVNAGFPALS